MRRLWEDFGKPGGRAPGYVERPYTIDDVRNTLATVAGDRAFAEDFIARYIQGHEVVDYAGLLAQAGFMLRPANPGAGFIGQLRFQDGTGGVRLVAAAPFGSPAYQAGLDRDDLILSVDGRQVRTAAELDGLVRGQRPGATLPIAFERRGRRVTASITVIADPRQQMVTVESAGQPLTDAQRRFRDAWFRGE
jgi:predicted metalloprotease with PDZ domain